MPAAHQTERDMNIFSNPTKSLPKQDAQIVRVQMKQNDIAGRTDHMPGQVKSGNLGIQHVGKSGS